MRIEGNRLVRMVMLEAMGLRGKVKWIEKLKQSLEEIGWIGVEMEELGKLSNGEVVQMLRDCVWRAVKESWVVQAEQHSKLKVVKELRKIRCEPTCIDVESKAIQRMLTKLRGGTAELREWRCVDGVDCRGRREFASNVPWEKWRMRRTLF